MPLTVTVAVREDAPVFSEVKTIMTLLFEPEAGDTCSHAGALPVTVQPVLDVMLNDCCPPVDVKFR